MIDLGNRKILNDGTVMCNIDAIVEMLYCDMDISNAVTEPSDEMLMFDKSNRMLDAGLESPIISDSEIYGDIDWYSLWLTPDGYRDADVESYCLGKCTTEEQKSRVQYEMDLFRERNMLPVLRHLMYLVDEFRSRKVVWGVGRGSSVSSYVLYLIGINRIDPLRFGLDVSEFLKPPTRTAP